MTDTQTIVMKQLAYVNNRLLVIASDYIEEKKEKVLGATIKYKGKLKYYYGVLLDLERDYQFYPNNKQQLIDLKYEIQKKIDAL